MGALVHRRSLRRGATLVEQVTVIAVVGVLAATAVSGAARLLNASLVHIAARDVCDLLALAREQATATGVLTAVRFDAMRQRIVVHAGTDTIARHELRDHGDVAIESTRDSMAYAPSGLGYGAANLRLILRRGASAETVTVSRLGRVRRD